MCCSSIEKVSPVLTAACTTSVKGIIEYLGEQIDCLILSYLSSLDMQVLLLAMTTIAFKVGKGVLFYMLS